MSHKRNRRNRRGYANASMAELLDALANIYGPDTYEDYVCNDYPPSAHAWHLWKALLERWNPRLLREIVSAFDEAGQNYGASGLRRGGG